jgi:hypothetical protein
MQGGSDFVFSAGISFASSACERTGMSNKLDDSTKKWKLAFRDCGAGSVLLGSYVTAARD